MARDDAGEGRKDAPWDFDLPDLGASATPEHHRRPRRQDSSPPPRETPRDGVRRPRRSSDDPLDFEAFDDDPIDQDDDDLIPHSETDLSTLGPRSQGPRLPDDVPDDDLPDDVADGPVSSSTRGPKTSTLENRRGAGRSADGRSAEGRSGDGRSAGQPRGGASGGRPTSRSGQPDDDLLPAWATGRPARRRPSGESSGRSRPSAASGAGGAGALGQQRGGRSDDVGFEDARFDDERHPEDRFDDRAQGLVHDDRHAERSYAGSSSVDEGWDDGWDDERRTGGRARVLDRGRAEDRYDDPDDEGYEGYDDWNEWEDERDEEPAPRWRRWIADPRRLTRLLVVLALVLLLIAGLALVARSLVGGSEETTEPEPEAAATEAAQAEDPFDGFSARPEDETTDGASGPAARACGDALSVTGSTDEPTYGEDADPILIMTLENTGEDPCMVNAGTARMDYRVTSGSETIFDSEHCQIEGQDRPIELEPGQTESARMQWNRQRSAAGCAEDLEPAGAGGYELEVSLGEDSAEPVEFTLE